MENKSKLQKLSSQEENIDIKTKYNEKIKELENNYKLILQQAPNINKEGKKLAIKYVTENNSNFKKGDFKEKTEKLKANDYNSPEFTQVFGEKKVLNFDDLESTISNIDSFISTNQTQSGLKHRRKKKKADKLLTAKGIKEKYANEGTSLKRNRKRKEKKRNRKKN